MNISRPFIFRPVGTTLLVIAIALAGVLGYLLLPVSPLPEVDYPSISISASLPGASPETMASSVATPLERQLGRIAGITEMTSSSNLGATNIVLQFDLNRDINAAARDVQAAINASASQLPSTLPSLPTYRKVNPSDAPILILTLTSDLYDRGQMYDKASSILAQKLSQVEGVGQVTVGGGALPAVRVELNPTVVNNLGLPLDDIRTALGAANANRPKGDLSSGNRTWALASTDQLYKASEYKPLIIAYRNGAPIRLADIADVTDSVEDVRTGGLFNGKPSVLAIVFREPGANIIDTVDRIRTLMPELQASLPAGMNLDIGMDRTTTIRASVDDVELTLGLAMCLVVLVVFLFLRDVRATLIPSVVVPISLLGTFGVMYLMGYSLDNLSLMALTVATGFVVDDAIVVIENITRYLEKGMKPVEAALKGAAEIGFTVVSISVSLVAVFIPILLMAGYVGRLFREFAVTLSVAIGVSMVVSLTATPMMCAVLLRDRHGEKRGWFYRGSEAVFTGIHWFYEKTLAFVLRHPLATLMVTLATVGFTIYLYTVVPKGLFPQQDTGRLTGNLQADQDISSQAMQRLVARFAQAVSSDPAVDAVVAFTGGGGSSTANTGRMFVTLKDLNVRKINSEQVIARLRGKLAGIPGASLILQAVQDVRAGGRSSRAQFQYALQGDTIGELNEWAPKVEAKIRTLPGIVDVNSDQQTHGLQTTLNIDRGTAARLNITEQAIDDALYDAFGQRQVSTMYTGLNQYHVVMEASPDFTKDPKALEHLYVRTTNGTPIPLSTIATHQPTPAALSINHQSQFPCITLSFNLRPGMSLGTAEQEVIDAQRELGVPATIQGSFAGTAQVFQESLASQPYLIAAALVAVYIVLGMLYESFIHPITILSTLPSAGVGALLALMLFKIDLSVIALIGIILLIGIVKKNAIMMIDFAIAAERSENMKPKDAIYQAAVLRFRPITMTTMAALLGGLPLAIGKGVGGELRQPLGVAIVGGLIFSQALTLYTTPVIYLYLDRLQSLLGRLRRNIGHRFGAMGGRPESA